MQYRKAIESEESVWSCRFAHRVCPEDGNLNERAKKFIDPHWCSCSTAVRIFGVILGRTCVIISDATFFQFVLYSYSSADRYEGNQRLMLLFVHEGTIWQKTPKFDCVDTLALHDERGIG